MVTTQSEIFVSGSSIDVRALAEGVNHTDSLYSGYCLRPSIASHELEWTRKTNHYISIERIPLYTGGRKDRFYCN